ETLQKNTGKRLDDFRVAEGRSFGDHQAVQEGRSDPGCARVAGPAVSAQEPIPVSQDQVILDGENLTAEAVWAVARGGAPVAVAPEALRKVARCRAVVDKLLESGAVVYGLTTGFGSLRDVLIAPHNVKELQANLIRSHSCGVGPPAAEDVVRAMLLLRAN